MGFKCASFAVDDLLAAHDLSGPVQIVGFEGVVPSPELVHHIDLFTCNDQMQVGIEAREAGV